MTRITISDDGSEYLIHVPREEFKRKDPVGRPQLVVPPRILTRRQSDVLAMVLERKQNKEIADALCLSIRTVKFHVSNLLAFYKVRGRVELYFAVQERLGPAA